MDTEKQFEEFGYILARNFMNPESYYKHIQDLEAKGKGFHGDGKVKKAVSFYQDKKFEELLENLIPELENKTGLSLFKTYSYARNYREGAILKNHRDRSACEVSVTINLGYDKKPWPIGILDFHEKVHMVTLEPGDALIYRGIEITHWREENRYGPCSQVFLHYVDQNGSYTKYKDDRKVGFDMDFQKFNKRFRFSITPSK